MKPSQLGFSYTRRAARAFKRQAIRNLSELLNVLEMQKAADEEQFLDENTFVDESGEVYFDSQIAGKGEDQRQAIILILESALNRIQDLDLMDSEAVEAVLNELGVCHETT